ncbi:MAG: ABC transporter permease [Thaumarchaeota archaeon]|nr:ABC transporter permease [Nitrososphaerota archaeon]
MRILVVFRAMTKNWLRSRSGLFFSFLFPVIFLLLFGSILGGASKPIPLAVQNNDLVGGVPTQLSQSFVTALNSTSVLRVNPLPTSTNVTAYVIGQAGTFGGAPRVLVIPQGFAAGLGTGSRVNLSYIASASDQLGAQVGSVVTSYADTFSSQLGGSTSLIGVDSSPSSARTLTSVDYYMPSILAAFMMTNGVIGLTSIASEFRRNGLTKRLSATPLTKLEWILGNVMSQALLAAILAGVMILLGIVVYHTAVTVDLYTLVFIATGAILFSGIGMTLAGIVRDPEAAAGLGNAIAFPMMLLSGTYWPVSIMPDFLQAVARVLPLTYFSEALRDSMVVGNLSAALFNLEVVAAFAVGFIVIGARVTRWKEA